MATKQKQTIDQRLAKLEAQKKKLELTKQIQVLREQQKKMK